MRQTVASKETSNVMTLSPISRKKEQQKYDLEIANKKKTRKTQLIKNCNETYDRKLFKFSSSIIDRIYRAVYSYFSNKMMNIYYEDFDNKDLRL